MTINIIACLDKNGGIGYKNNLLFHIKKDMERFRQLTTGHTIIMGRKTYDSLPNGALPNRHNIVISHQNLNLKDCDVYHSIEEAMKACSMIEQSKEQNQIFVIGGATIYEQIMPIANYLYLTIVDEYSTNVDTYFPKIDKNVWQICFQGEKMYESNHENKEFSFMFETLEKKKEIKKK